MEDITNMDEILADDDFSEFEDLFQAANKILTDSDVNKSPTHRKSIANQFLESRLKQPTPIKKVSLNIEKEETEM